MKTTNATLRAIRKDALRDFEYWARREEDPMLSDEKRAEARNSRLAAQKIISDVAAKLEAK